MQRRRRRRAAPERLSDDPFSTLSGSVVRAFLDEADRPQRDAMDDRAFADDRDAAPPLIKSFAGSNSPGRQSHSDAA